MNDSKTEIQIFNNYTEIADFVRSTIVKDLVRKNFTMALSGGNTPRSVYSLLAENKKPLISWEKIMFFWGDERCVHPENQESNYKMAKETLFDKIHPAEDKICRIKGENNPELEKDRYGKVVFSNTKGIFDLMFLGLGTDGHTASIFPDQMHLLTSDEVCGIATHPDSGQIRVTLTGPILNASKKIVFIVTGSEKSKVVYDILHKEGDWKKYPASYIKPVDGEIIWILDRNAAARI
jgi:6-phosphogluconolactonase